VEEPLKDARQETTLDRPKSRPRRFAEVLARATLSAILRKLVFDGLDIPFSINAILSGLHGWWDGDIEADDFETYED